VIVIGALISLIASKGFTDTVSKMRPNWMSPIILFPGVSGPVRIVALNQLGVKKFFLNFGIFWGEGFETPFSRTGIKSTPFSWHV